MMKVISKVENTDLEKFSWLNFDYLPDSKGFRFEVYFDPSHNVVSQSIIHFYSFFRENLSGIRVKPFGQNGSWGSFCIDTWDLENDKYDYSPENKEEPTASYLKMLQDSNVEPGYTGMCECSNWDKFLYVIIHCVVAHKAPYSLMFYDLDNGFVFYFHHSGSLGLYYKELNKGVVNVIEKVKCVGLEIKSSNDERISGVIE